MSLTSAVTFFSLTPPSLKLVPLGSGQAWKRKTGRRRGREGGRHRANPACFSHPLGPFLTLPSAHNQGQAFVTYINLSIYNASITHTHTHTHSPHAPPFFLPPLIRSLPNPPGQGKSCSRCPPGGSIDQLILSTNSYKKYDRHEMATHSSILA